MDAFVAVLTSGGDELLYHSFLGGGGNDRANGIALVADGRFAITGSTDSTNFPTSATPYRDTLAGGTDAFVSLFDIASRTVTYSYDGLQRLTGATENPGTTYAYGYDKVGNRTSITVGTATSHLTYTVTDQVIGWTYDAAGNLKNDGTTQSDYDALGRLTQTITAGQTQTYSYNGDNVLIAQLANGTTTRYTQDLVSPLSQVLQTKLGSATTNYLYGMDRLASVSGSTTTWYGTDALGSVRLTMSNAGLPLDTFNYDPWGTPQGAAPPTFGFTGELQDAGTGLVNLRARWYQPQHGRFGSRDPFEGFDEQPYSLHSYQYAYSNPVFNTDPTGECIPEDVPGLGEEDCHWIFETGSKPNWEDWRAYWNGPAGQIGYAIAGYLAWPVAVGFGIANLYQSSRIYIQDPTTGNFLWMAVDAALFYCGARAAGGPSASFRFAPQGAGAAMSVSNGAWAAKAVRGGVPIRMLMQNGPPKKGTGGGPTISRQQQAAHVHGTKEYNRRVARGEPTSYFDDWETAVERVEEAWQKGTIIQKRTTNIVKDYEFNRPIGRGPKGGTQSKVRVHQDGKGVIHGHPAGPETP